MAHKLNDFLNQKMVEYLWDAAEAAEKAAPDGSDLKQDTQWAKHHLGEVLALLDPSYGEPLPICPLFPEVEQRVTPWCGFDGKAVAQYVNAAVRFCMNVGWRLDELESERQSERIR